MEKMGKEIKKRSEYRMEIEAGYTGLPGIGV